MTTIKGEVKISIIFKGPFQHFPPEVTYNMFIMQHSSKNLQTFKVKTIFSAFKNKASKAVLKFT